MTEYNLSYLQELFGRSSGAISQNAVPLNLAKVRGRWNSIVAAAIDFIKVEYAKDALPLSARQVHYYLVHQPLGYENTIKDNKGLLSYLVQARVGGQVAW